MPDPHVLERLAIEAVRSARTGALQALDSLAVHVGSPSTEEASEMAAHRSLVEDAFEALIARARTDPEGVLDAVEDVRGLLETSGRHRGRAAAV